MAAKYIWAVQGDAVSCLPTTSDGFDEPTAEFDSALRNLALSLGREVVDRVRYRRSRAYFAKLSPIGGRLWGGA